MKSLLLQFLFGMLFFNLQCSQGKTETSTNHISLPTNSQNNENTPLKQIDESKQLIAIERAVKELSDNYDVINLKEKRLQKNEMELRIWSSIGFDYERCFILNKDSGNWNAFVLTPKVADGEIVRTKQGKIVSEKTSFSTPKSGWEEFDKHLIEQGICYPLTYSFDKEYVPPIIDEGVIILEVKQNMNYSLVSFREFTKSEDGKNILNLCKKIEKEFDAVIGCGN